MAQAQCESCGSTVEPVDLEEVHRVYVVPESWDTPGSETEVDEVERWCFPCRTMFPHRLIGPGEGAS